jgi:RNA polymerase sigma-70 factor, ECF subfamily
VTDRRRRRSARVQATVAEAPPTPTSFEDLYRDTVDDLYAYVATLVRDRSAAEEVVAAAFERAYRKHASFDARRGSQRQWLFGIARNAALDELRRRKRTAALLADPEDPVAGSRPVADEDDAAEAAVRRAAVRSALAGLDPRERELIALKFHAGLSNAEIAKVLGISVANAGTRVHRAVTRLRKACHAPS